MRRSAFTLIELLVLIALMILATAYTLSLVGCDEHADARLRIRCANNLRQIGEAIRLYANENHGQFPRTVYAQGDDVVPTWGTSSSAVDPFGSDGPQPNDVTAAMFLLLRTQETKPETFTCPTTKAEPDTFGGGSAKSRSNFSDWRKNLSFSFCNPYPNNAAAPKDGTTPQTPRNIERFVVAADLNPGTTRGRNVLGVTLTSSHADLKSANSTNHDGDTQNVLYGDGHIENQNSPFCGVDRDNIYTTRDGKVTASPVDVNDSVLLPAQDW
jgi:hypothetical protein